MATLQGCVRELWVGLFLKRNGPWLDQLTWPDRHVHIIRCLFSGGANHHSGSIQRKKSAVAQRELSPTAHVPQFSEAQPKYQIPKTLPQVPTCWFAFADWEFEQRFPAQQSVNWELGLMRQAWVESPVDGRQMSAAIPVCSREQSVILSQSFSSFGVCQ